MKILILLTLILTQYSTSHVIKRSWSNVVSNIADNARHLDNFNQAGRVVRNTDDLSRVVNHSDDISRLSRNSDDISRVSRNSDDISRVSGDDISRITEESSYEKITNLLTTFNVKWSSMSRKEKLNFYKLLNDPKLKQDLLKIYNDQEIQLMIKTVSSWVVKRQVLLAGGSVVAGGVGARSVRDGHEIMEDRHHHRFV
jgi:hypothetical protein